MSGFNAYKVLCIKKDATFEEIKKSYYALAYKHHPDKSGSTKERSEIIFKDISYAYEILSDADTRCEYDDFMSEYPERFSTTDFDLEILQSRSPISTSGGLTPWIYNSLKNKITGFFTSAGWSESSLLRTKQRRAPDTVTKTIWITLEDVYRGCTIEVISNGIINNVMIDRGTKSGTRYAIINEEYTVKIEPHPVFQRGGGGKNTIGSRTSDILTFVTIPYSQSFDSQKGYISDLGGNKLMWKGSDEVDSKIVIKGRGLPYRAGINNNTTQNVFGNLIVFLTKSRIPFLIEDCAGVLNL